MTKPLFLFPLSFLMKILELTLLMASYINYWSSAPPSTSSPASASAPGVSLGPRSDRKLWNMDSRHFPAMTYNTKGPTLL